MILITFELFSSQYNIIDGIYLFLFSATPAGKKYFQSVFYLECIFVIYVMMNTLKGTRHKQNSLSGNTLFNYMPTYTRSQKKS